MTSAPSRSSAPRFDYAEYKATLSKWEEKHAPEELFLQGRVNLLNTGRRCSIVGSRKASATGLRIAGILAAKMVQHRITVVSGLAAGIDTAAHRAAIEAGGDTIAVIGTPLGQAYPIENTELQESIAKDHLLVSQFSTSIGPRAFPIRNRTMALISDATFIVEATEVSGTRHQGWEAIRVGRELFIHESVCRQLRGSWAGKMQEYGARCFTEDMISDLLEDLIPRAPLALHPNNAEHTYA